MLHARQQIHNGWCVQALAIALLTNHGLAYRNPIPPVADAALAPKATQDPKLKSVTSSPDSGWFSGQVQASTTPQWPPGHSSEPKLNQSQSPLVCYVENLSSYGKNVMSLSKFTAKVQWKVETCSFST